MSNKWTVLFILFALFVLAFFLIPWPALNPMDQDIFNRYADPFQNAHWLGTDELGRDVFSRLLIGTKATLIVALSVAPISVIIGLLLGGSSGFFGGTWDLVINKIIEFFLSVPILPFLIIFSAIDISRLGFSPEDMGPYTQIIFILIIFGWARPARIFRAQTMAQKERVYVEASIAVGNSKSNIFLFQIIPLLSPSIWAAVGIVAAESILFEAGISFLGLGIQPPNPSLGNMLYGAQELLNHHPWQAIFPGIMIFFIVLGINLIPRPKL